MIALLYEFLLAAGASLAGSIVLKATVVAALGLFGAWLLRGRRAALRHAILAGAFAVLVVLPAGAIFAPPVRIAVNPTSAPSAAVFSSSADSSRNTPAPLTISAPSKHAPAFPLSTWLLGVWLCGTVLCLMPAAIGVWQVDRIRRSALPWGRAQSAAAALASECGMQRGIDVGIHEALPGPMTCGLLKPAILFPCDAESWNGEDLNRALIHELEHARRWDWAIHGLVRAVCAGYWFHPLVWMAWRRLALEAERACDDAVLGRSEAAAYADQLVGLARRLQSPAKAPLLAMASRADLGARVRAILDSRQPRGRAGVGAVAMASAAAVALALTISPLRVVLAAQVLDGTDWQTTAGGKTASTTSPAATVPTAVIEASTPKRGSAVSSTEKALAFDAASVEAQQNSQTAPQPSIPQRPKPQSPFEAVPQAPKESRPEPPNALIQTVPRERPPEDIIEAIYFRGSRRVPQGELLAMISSKPGDPYKEDALHRDFILLGDTGLFDDIRMEREAGQKGWIIRYVLVERRIVGAIKNGVYCHGNFSVDQIIECFGR